MASLLILFNPVSGGGRAERAARGLLAALTDAGHTASLSATRPDGSDGWLDQLLDGVEALVVAGGDGAVHGAAGAAIRTGTPMYHLPYGTANLFAREFGMNRRTRTLLAALDRFEVRRVDTGEANGHPFVLMASVGFDAEVVHDLTAARGRSISYFSYLAPMWRQMRRWRPPRVEVFVDGTSLGPPGPALVVVANARHYAFGLNPAPRAEMTDGKLDVVLFPVPTFSRLLWWIAKCMAGRHLSDSRLLVGRGTTIRVVCDAPELVQLDGDPPPGGVGARTAELTLSVRQGVLPVLVPP